MNPVDLAGSPSFLLVGGGPPRACTGGGAAPGRSVSFSSPLFTPGAGRDSSFGPRAGGATGAPARIVSCIGPEFGRGVGRELSRGGGADEAGGATGAGPTLVISRVLVAAAGARDSEAAAEGRDSGRATSCFPAASPWTGRTARVTSLWVGRGGGPTRVISGGAGRDMPRVVSISGCECGVNVREPIDGARLSEVTGCCGGTLGGRRFDGASLTATSSSSSSSSTAIAGYDASDPAASSADALSSGFVAVDGLTLRGCAGPGSTANGVADEGSEIRSAIGPGRWVCV